MPWSWHCLHPSSPPLVGVCLPDRWRWRAFFSCFLFVVLRRAVVRRRARGGRGLNTGGICAVAFCHCAAPLLQAEICCQHSNPLVYIHALAKSCTHTHRHTHTHTHTRTHAHRAIFCSPFFVMLLMQAGSVPVASSAHSR